MRELPAAGREVALTFDDGPSEYTEEILDTLIRRRVPATFFPIGLAIEEHPETIRREARDGFAVGDHTVHHPRMSDLSPADQEAEVLGRAADLRRSAALAPNLFRPPFGLYDEATLKLLRRQGMLAVLWTVEIDDYELPGPEAIEQRVLEAVHPGAIVLMHDGGGDRSETWPPCRGSSRPCATSKGELCSSETTPTITVMAEETFRPLSAAELAEIDARYEPFPSFEDWPKDLPSRELWQAARDEFQHAADQATEDDLHHAQAIARRVAAFDTGAIEGLYSTNRGLTFTVAEQAALWEQKVDAQGPDARALFEAQLRAFELVLDHVTEHFPKLTQARLRRIHEEITAPQETYVVHTPAGTQEQPLPRGEYKRYPNHVRTSEGAVHAYAPVEATQSEMQRLVDEVGSEAFQVAHPVIQASYAHYALVVVHPFADGNGRLARAAASVYTYRDASIPLMVLDEHRVDYLSALAVADTGNASPFVEIIERVTREALNLVRDILLTAMAPQPKALLEELNELYENGAGGQDRDQAVHSFLERLLPEVEKRVGDLDVPRGVELQLQRRGETGQPPPDGFRSLDGDGTRSLRMILRSAPPASVTLLRDIDVFVDQGAEDGAVFLRCAQSLDEELYLRRSDLEPYLSSMAKHRVENFVNRVLGNGLDELLRTIRRRLGR